MLSLIAACCVFVGIHIFISGTPVRDRLIAVIGERAYMGGFSVASLGALVWMAMAYNRAEYVPLWETPMGLRHVVVLLMLLATYLVIAGTTAPNPTSSGQKIDQASPAYGIIRVTRHPFLWGVVVWSVAHLMANGHLAALMLFGSLLILALAGPHLIDAKLARRDREAWLKLADTTSWVPFLAIVQGRNRLSWRELSWWRPLLSVALWAVIVFWAHEFVFGLAPLPM